MSVKPAQELLADPRFEGACRSAMRKHGIPPFMELQIRKLVAGKTDPRTLQCCHSGCQPCAQDILGCTERILKTLAKPKRRWRFW